MIEWKGHYHINMKIIWSTWLLKIPNTCDWMKKTIPYQDDNNIKHMTSENTGNTENLKMPILPLLFSFSIWVKGARRLKSKLDIVAAPDSYDKMQT